MALFAVFSGFSIVLILPVIEKVFIRETVPDAPIVHVGPGLRQTLSQTWTAFQGGDGLGGGFQAGRVAFVEGLIRLQNQAPPLEVLTWLCIITVVAVFFKNLSDIIRKIAFIRVEQATTEALRKDLFGRVLEFPLGTFDRIASGQLISRIVTDVELVKQLTINNAANFVNNLFLVLVYLTISIWASFQLALGSLLIVPPIALMTGKLASKLNRQSGRAQARIADLTVSLNETLGGIRIVKGFGTEPQEERRFARATGRYRRAVVRLLSLDSLAAPLSEFWGVMIGVGVLYVGGKMVLNPNSELQFGVFLLFFLALISMLHPLKQLSNVVARFQRGAAAADRVFEILDTPGETDPPDAIPLPRLKRELVFEDVSFLYEPKRPVLRDVSFRAPMGTTTALVGPSGAGKSTLVDLIPRFYRPDSGRILIDGIDIGRARLRDLRSLIGIVSQDPILFDDTVANNIAYGTPEATLVEIIDAAKAANAHEFIQKMSNEYQTLVGERGILLSGGQRQRLALARAVLRNPSILILDEATSSLDTESEALVQEALERLLTGRTTFVIAHRLSTIMQSDTILVLDEGRIVETGTHTELLTGGGLYNRLYTLQFRSEENKADAVET